MLGGRRNPFSVSRIVEAVQQAKAHAQDVAHVSESLAQANLGEIPWMDIEIQFIGASALPKMDVVGSADPYFVADIDGKLSFVSAVKANTQAPVWNEIWRVKNVPAVADLHCQVFDKDEGAPHDDYVGKFKTSIAHGAKEAEIQGPLFRKARGTFWLKIKSTPSTAPTPSAFPYLFDGPPRFSRHCSPTVGRLTNLNDARLYSTWKLYLRHVPLYFADAPYQGWNRTYKAAQSIFQGPASLAVRSGIQAGHRMLYARNAGNGFGVLETREDVLQLLRARPGSRGVGTGAEGEGDGGGAGAGAGAGGGGGGTERIKPAVYTYIISADDDSFRFSETGAAFFVDFASKHALHSNCAERVRYSGEFHPRPVGGWSALRNDTLGDEEVEWEIVVDNNSGTYAPDKALLGRVRGLLESNFGGVGVVAMDRGEKGLEESREMCREYAVKWRGVRREELQPHAQAGEETLSHHAKVKMGAAEGLGCN